ncbi:arylamine N-acetyltransferase family protein [Parathalassolituus penaei]|uniref:Arylamine N-acetyltransferase n=1 Tax=Parathalassolituus penaei TaxID=2997323 RepID=A0A9X3IR86_9GAMM|nr:arylamine N-acetyltransferase [Parathalassolituus penaei]MCY0963965.1 arylamine N-acetyltransferase [Parathalassolituus penaei]
MKAENFSLADYFRRIGFTGTPSASIETVAGMMRCQLFSVPFENLDVQAGKVVSLVPEDIVSKIVGDQPTTRGRGGYCYEVNGLFAMALEALGIPWQFVAARPMFYPVRRPKTHAAIVVTLNGEQWLCDLGFGSYGIRAPMNLAVLDTEVRQDQDTFMLTRDGDQGYLLQALVQGEWARQYAFDLYAPEWVDFAPANFMNSTHPDTIFVQKPLVVLFNPDGRSILLGDQLKEVTAGEVSQSVVAAADYDAVLARRFGLPGLIRAGRVSGDC